MAKKIFRKLLPHSDVIIRNRWIKLLGPRLQDPLLWHINRRACSAAVALGIFCAFIPVPFQMLIAAVFSIWMRVNILVAVPMFIFMGTMLERSGIAEDLLFALQVILRRIPGGLPPPR